MKKWPVNALAVLAVAIGCIIPLTTSRVDALESGGVGAIPANPRPDSPRSKSIFLYDADHGDIINDAVKVINHTDKERQVAVYAVDSQVSSDGAFACAQAVDKKVNVGSWVNLEQSVVTVGPNDTVTVPFTITIPDKVDAGEQNGCIVVQDQSSDAQQRSGGVVLSFRSALRVAITIPGDLTAKLSLKNVNQTHSSDGNIIVTPEYKNEGNISLDTTIDVSFSSLFGEVEKSGGQFPVLSKSDAKFNFKFSNLSWGGIYKRTVTTKYATIASVANNNQSGEIERHTETLFIAPRTDKLIIEVLLLGLIAAAIIYFLRKRSEDKLMRSALVNYRVESGDSLESIASYSGISWKKLAKLNHLKSPYTIKPGDTLRVPKKRLNSKKTRLN